MKTWKENIIADIIAESVDSRVISLREIAAQRGIKHIAAGDVQDIMQGVAKRLEGYRPVQLMGSKNDSLFCSLCWVEDGVEFDDGSEFEKGEQTVSKTYWAVESACYDGGYVRAKIVNCVEADEKPENTEKSSRHADFYTTWYESKAEAEAAVDAV